VVGAVDERKALERLTRAARNLTSGARLGASQPPPPEGEEPAPDDGQRLEAPPETPETPQGQ
jgi:hypothetical protein